MHHSRVDSRNIAAHEFRHTEKTVSWFLVGLGPRSVCVFVRLCDVCMLARACVSVRACVRVRVIYVYLYVRVRARVLNTRARVGRRRKECVLIRFHERTI